MEIVLLEQDRDVLRVRVQTPLGDFELIANIRYSDDVLYLEEMHLGGPGPNTIGPAAFRRAIREFGRQVMELADVATLVIEGGIRTSGARPGHRPRRIVLRRDDQD